MKLLVIYLEFIVVNGIADVTLDFSKHQLVPDILKEAPKEFLLVKFGDKPILYVGEEFLISEVKTVPSVEWNAEKSSFYTLVMSDPDGPTRRNASLSEVKHWLVVNIPGSDLSKGETIVEFKPSNPPSKKGLHRYAFLIYKQPEKVDFSKEQHIDTSLEAHKNRWHWSVQKFAEEYNLGTPLAGNMYQTYNP